MTVYGLTPTGFVTKPLQVVRDELNTAFRAAFGASINVSDRSILGQIIGILAERYALLWELAEAVHGSFDPNKATGFALDAVSALTGTKRPLASFSTAMLTWFGVPGSLIQGGTGARTRSTGKQFNSNEDATILTVSNWTAGHTYAEGDRVFSDGDKIYQCTVGGAAGAIAISGIGTDIVDNAAHWKTIGVDLPSGTGAVDVEGKATETGAIVALAGDISEVVASVTGLVAVTNVADAAVGRNVGSDEELRVLRKNELSGNGVTTQDAIRAALLKLDDIVSVSVFVNNTDVTDTSVTPAMPPHSVEALVRTGSDWSVGDPRDQQIYNTIFANLAAGIATTGNQTGSCEDSQGLSHTVKFSRPTEIPIYATLNITVDPTVFPADGVTQIQDAITAWGDTLSTGKDAVPSAISAKAFQVDGVLDVVSCLIDVAPSPTLSAAISVDSRHLATYATSRIVVNVTNGTP